MEGNESLKEGGEGEILFAGVLLLANMVIDRFGAIFRL